MKKLFALLLVLALLLSGCAGQEARETEPQQTTAPSTTGAADPTDPTVPEEPEKPERPDLGVYVENSEIEQSTNGAIRQYEVDKDNYAVAVMGDGLLLFSGTEGDTTLTLLREGKEPVVKQIDGEALYPDGLAMQIDDEGLCYYSEVERAVVFLDRELQQKDLLKLPEDIIGTPLISQDQEMIYYFDADSLDRMEVKTGLTHYLKECTLDEPGFGGIHFDGSLLECFFYNGDIWETMFIDAATGELVSMAEGMALLSTFGDRFFAHHYEGGDLLHYLFGQRDGQIMEIGPRAISSSMQDLLELDAALSIAYEYDHATMELYGLTSGNRYAMVELPAGLFHGTIAADTDEGYIWFTASGIEEGSATLYCWDPELSPTDDTQTYTKQYYTAQDPDVEGLAQIQKQAEAMGQRHGVDILVYEEAAGYAPFDFTFASAHQVSLYEHYLPVLDEALSAYPEGFFEKLGEMSDNGTLTVSLVLGAYGDNDLGAISEADGVQFMLDGDFYLTLVMNERFEATLYHEMFHVIDIFVLNNETSYDNWDDLNPKDFRYDYDYLENEYREDFQYLEDDTRSFIDMYSMSYPKEDRARIMEYAMQDGQESYFTSETMQAKLEMLCKGIRKAFGLKNYGGALIWEQYLNK